MNTVKIIKFDNGYRCEFHGSNPIASEDYFLRGAERLLNDAAEWCSREVALTQQAELEVLSCAYCGSGSVDQICRNPECSTPDNGGLLTDEQRRSLVEAANNPRPAAPGQRATDRHTAEKTALQNQPGE